MLKNRKLTIAIVVVLVALGIVYKTMSAKPAPKQKVAGTIYVLPKDFLLNLSDGRYAKLTVALQLAPGQSDGASADAAASSEATVGTLPEEPLVREIVTNTITNRSGEDLTSASGRRQVKREILAAVDAQTDVKVLAVLFPDLTVQ
ncbi:MAG TPA: flagellar basal body-associated FliL family protein [Solirubrobacteraceae bacterium]|nr:flagellar basal body-associated FliL family protein [Solirubrobacteraceae bacterium]